MISCPGNSWWRRGLPPPHHGPPISLRLVQPLLCTLRGSTLPRRHPGRLGLRPRCFLRPESCCATPKLHGFIRAMKQWRDDVDRLLGMTHSSSARPSPQSSRRQHEASASVRSPSVRAAPTEDLRAELNRRHMGEDAPVSLERSNDLRAELNRRRAGEDARISLERVRERRQNVEGRNLDYDFAAVAPQTPTGARIQAGVPLAGVGCAALADHLRAVTWPSKFRPHLPEKYDGTSNLSEFLQVYVTAITATGGNTAVMATYFHVALSGPAQTWLMNLTPGSVYSWEELCARFTVNFASAYQQHGMEAHLHAVRQEPGKTLRAFMSRFTKVRGTIPRIFDASIITAFRQGVRDEKILEKLATHDVETVSMLFALADKCATAAEGRAWHSAPQTGVVRRVARVPSLMTAKRRRRKTATTRSHRLPLRLSQRRLRAGASATSAHGHREATAAHALYTPTVAIAPPNAARLSSLRSASASGTSNLPRMATHPTAGLARRGSMTVTWPRESETSGISPSSRSSRTSSLKASTPVTTTIATRSCTSCTAGAGSSPPTGTSSPCAERSFRWSRESRRLLHISGGGAPPSPSGHPTAPTTWQGPVYYCSSPPLS
jgi:hypothetical protein